MFPRTETTVRAQLPTDAVYWIPSEEELDSGLAYFHDTWNMAGVRPADAREIIGIEKRFAALADSLAEDADTFDQLAEAFECDYADGLPEESASGAARERIDAEMNDEGMPPFGELDLGIAGLVYALSAFGCFPAASCRGHSRGGWSDHPVVFIATDRARAEALAPMVERSGCGWAIDPERGALLEIVAPSIECTMHLADLVMGSIVDSA